jgi:hypothetical protein
MRSWSAPASTRALGGDHGGTLYLCTAPGFAEHERRDTREARLVAVEVEVAAA